MASELLRACVDELVRHGEHIEPDSDPENVHQARVAARKLRSDLRTLSGVFDPGWSTPLRDELQWLGAALGTVRDEEVMLGRLRARIEALPSEDREPASALSATLTESVHLHTRELMVVLRSERYQDLLDSLTKPPIFKEDGNQPAVPILSRVTQSAWRKLRRAVSNLPNEPADLDLHRVRILAKRCRYAAEALAVCSGRRAAAFAEACKVLQDVLGEHQDSVVMRQWLRNAAPGLMPLQALAAGEIIGAEQQAAANARAQWPTAWRQVRRARLPKAK